MGLRELLRRHAAMIEARTVAGAFPSAGTRERAEEARAVFSEALAAFELEHHDSLEAAAVREMERHHAERDALWASRVGK